MTRALILKTDPREKNGSYLRNRRLISLPSTEDGRLKVPALHSKHISVHKNCSTLLTLSVTMCLDKHTKRKDLA